MNTVLFTFSGTGNTMTVASMLQEAFFKLSSQAECCSIETVMKNGTMPDLSGIDAIGIGYPIYAFNAPMIVLNFIKTLPSSGGKPAYLFKTSGEPFFMNDASSAALIRELRRKGYRVFYERHFLMPYNIMFRYPDALVKQMLIAARILSLDMAKRILSGEVSLPRMSFQSRVFSWMFRIQRPGAALSGRLCRANRHCCLCMQCVSRCPVGNIHIKNGQIRFGWKCVMCMRCVMFCPRHAIRFGLIDGLAVRGAYDFQAIVHDGRIPSAYVTETTKGYFRLFKRYFKQVDDILKGNDIE